jgi:DNA ligase (NAD+)
MEQNQSTNRIEELRNTINYHNYRYYVLDDPVISDQEFDLMMRELITLEGNDPDLITSDSPTQRLGHQTADRFIKTDHPKPILSLANSFDENDICDWYDRISKLDGRVKQCKFTLEPKIDGLTVVLHYTNGVFIKGATRGDGVTGEDITSNLKTIKTIPMKIPVDPLGIPPPSYLVVRGEVFIEKKDFEKLNRKLAESGEKTYQNPRNTAAGSLRQLDPALTATRPLKILCYSVVDTNIDPPVSQWGSLKLLRELGFPVPESARRLNSIEEVIQDLKTWTENRDSLPFEVDGVVIKLDDLLVAEVLGITGKDPRGAIAFKFPAKEVTTTLDDIGVNIGRTGVLTPYAILEPVEVGGVVIKQATLHNFDYIREKDIRIGDRVLIKRAGDVIPYVIGPIIDIRNNTQETYIPPEICPTCGEVVEHLEGEVAWYCVNAACPAQLVRNVEHFVSRSAMDIDGLGIKIVEQLVNSGAIRDAADLYSLTEHDLRNLEGFAEKKVENLLKAIAESKNRNLSRFIYALGIKGVGEVLSTEIANRYRDLDSLSLSSFEEIQEMEGVGPNIAQAIVDWFDRDRNREVLEKFKQQGIWPISQEDSRATGELPLLGKTFVITGTLEGISREDAKSMIERAGGKVIESVSKKTDYLVLGENPGSKFEKAKELRIAIIDKKTLLNIIFSNEQR